MNEEGWPEKKSTRQYRKVIWDIVTVPDTVAIEPEGCPILSSRFHPKKR